MMKMLPGLMESKQHSRHIRGMVQPCAKCADRKTGNKGRGTGVPQPFLFVGLVGQLRKRGFGKWFVKWQ